MKSIKPAENHPAADPIILPGRIWETAYRGNCRNLVD